MQKVSKAYKESMKSSLRERGYIMITFGLINQDLQAKANVSSGDLTWFSRKETIFGEKTENIDYAVLDQDFTKVDGSMFFLPRSSSGKTMYDTGIVSNRMVYDAEFDLTIAFNTIATDFKGLTIDFGENYPVNFDIIGSSGEALTFRDNIESKWSTDEVLKDCTSITLKVYKMKNERSRCRIKYIMFGYGLVYYNDSVMDSTLETQVSPIGATVPQIDFSVKLKNLDHYFDVDNPNSAINYLETGQEMNVMYGYDTPGSDEIEWIQGQHLWCSAWDSDNSSATIRCQDIFRNMETEYYQGTYNSAGQSYYDLAVNLIKATGHTDYYIDPRLKHLYTKNPLPRVKIKEGLQIVANACRCILVQSRDGKIEIKSNYIPEASISTNGEESYSNVNNIKNNSEKKEYASLAKDYTVVDGSMFFLPKSGKAGITTGYVSKAISKSDGTFTTNPTITFSMEAVRSYYGLNIEFGSVLPSEFIIRSYNENTLVNEYVIEEDEISRKCSIVRTFDDCNKIQIEFTKTATPQNHIVMNYFALNDVVDFTMTKRDMTTYPTATKQELVKEVVVPCYLYQLSDKEDRFVDEEVEVTAGETRIYYIGDPSYGYSVRFDEVATDKAEIVASGSYYVQVRFKETGTFKLGIFGHSYKIVERNATKSLHAVGKTIRWENPLISDMSMANDLADWLGEYYLAGIEYEYDTRGNPELDATDIIYQENDYRKNMKVNIYRYKMNFKQSFSGHVVARRIGG